jgi:hypothetical protein
MILRLITLAKFIMNKPPIMKRWLIIGEPDSKRKIKIHIESATPKKNLSLSYSLLPPFFFS